MTRPVEPLKDTETMTPHFAYREFLDVVAARSECYGVKVHHDRRGPRVVSVSMTAGEGRRLIGAIRAIPIRTALEDAVADRLERSLYAAARRRESNRKGRKRA